jgi:regulator of sigma E protease
MSYLGTLLLLGLLILIHEAGHFAAARLAGIPVASFAVGFGPRLWSRRWGGTEISLRAFPLGGFVAPAVEGEAEFRAIPLGRRLAFFAGGPLANLASAVPLFAALNVLSHGFSEYAITIAPFGQALEKCRQMALDLPRMLAAPSSLSGVVGIVVEGGRQAQAGHAVEVAIVLSLSLALLNLLPIPVLDGGQILLACLEEAFPRLVRLRAVASTLGILLLAGLMVYVNVHDVVRYWGRG